MQQSSSWACIKNRDIAEAQAERTFTDVQPAVARGVSSNHGAPVSDQRYLLLVNIYNTLKTGHLQVTDSTDQEMLLSVANLQ